MDHDELLRHRILYVDGAVDDDLANRVAARLLLLDRESPADVTMYINSAGGSVGAGMAVIDTMRYVSCDVATCAIGVAAGMAQCLLTAGAKGKRGAVPQARILMLAPSLEGSGAVEEAGRDEALERTRLQVSAMLAADTGQTAERIRADWGPHAWFTAEEARAYGLVDHIAAPRPVPRPARPAAASLEQGVRRMAVDVLADVLVWRLGRDRWEAVGRGLDAMRRALAAGDPAGLRRAVADVEMAGPHRILGLEDSALLPLPERHRERVNELIHQLDPEPPEQGRQAFPDDDFTACGDAGAPG
ncbi:CATRA system-associated protein [Streptomyces coerulescens]|uniref:ATP-dependent Clp protease proteolytic subunit n=1 Tax=Streptomyces coerulescens TaxID=29304 RepID=A0ABW0CTI1_STRCD